MPQPLPRTYASRQRELDRAKVDKIIKQTEPELASTGGATAPGDSRRLRGIPAVSRGTSGAITGTDPARALFSKER